MSLQSNPSSGPLAVNGTPNSQVTLRPLTPAPGDSQTRTEVNKKQLLDNNPKMVSQSVNKTALHPGGVQ